MFDRVAFEPGGERMDAHEIFNQVPAVSIHNSRPFNQIILEEMVFDFLLLRGGCLLAPAPLDYP